MARRGSTSSCRIDWTLWRVWLAAMSICPTMTASQFKCKFPRSSSRWRCTSSCAQSLISWPPTCFTTVSQCSALVSGAIPRGEMCRVRVEEPRKAVKRAARSLGVLRPMNEMICTVLDKANGSAEVAKAEEGKSAQSLCRFKC